MKYKILSHTADLRLEVNGATMEELFQNAALALADVLKKARPAGELLEEKIRVESANQSALLVDFLNEILAKSQINKAVYRVSRLALRDSRLEAELIGVNVPEFDEDVKAVTYHEADIKKEGDFWTTKLVLDI